MYSEPATKLISQKGDVTMSLLCMNHSNGQNCSCLRILHVPFLLVVSLLPGRLWGVTCLRSLLKCHLPGHPTKSCIPPKHNHSAYLTPYVMFMWEHHCLTHYTFYLSYLFSVMRMQALWGQYFFIFSCLIHCYILRTYLEMCLTYNRNSINICS